MKKLLLWAVAVFFTGCCVFAGARHPEERQTLAEEIKGKTVALVYYDSDKNEMSTYCAGVWISREDIVTAGHCIRIRYNAKDNRKWDGVGRAIEYSTPDDIESGDSPTYFHIGYVKAYDYERDIALIKVDEKDMPKKQRDHAYALLSQDKLHDGDRIHTVGNPLGHWFTYMSGWVSSAERFDIAREFYEHDFKSTQINVSLTYGNSGGGCFDDNGKLVGIAAFIDPKHSGLGFCIHRDVVKEFIDDNRVK